MLDCSIHWVTPAKYDMELQNGKNAAFKLLHQLLARPVPGAALMLPTSDLDDEVLVAKWTGNEASH